MNLHHFTRDARYTLTKSILKNKLKVEVYYRILRPDAVVIGIVGLVEDLVNSDEHFLPKFINVADVFLLFDFYFENSIKSLSRLGQIETY